MFNHEKFKAYDQSIRGSTLEYAAISDLMIEINPSLERELSSSKELLHSIANILSAVILK